MKNIVSGDKERSKIDTIKKHIENDVDFSAMTISGFRKWAQDNHHINRLINNFIVTWNFYDTYDPYSACMVRLQDGYVILDDSIGLVSIIDAKTSKMAEGIGKNLDRTFQNPIRKLVRATQKDHRSSIKLIKDLDKNIQDVDPSEIQKTIKNRQRAINKLYNETISIYPELWENNKEEQTNRKIEMTDQGREYFSAIIASFLNYNIETNFLGRSWELYLFPKNTWAHVRDLLSQGKSLSVDQIADLIVYLLQQRKKPPHKEKLSDMRDRHQRNHMKSIAINELYAMLYSEQKHNYNTIVKLSDGFSDSMREVDKNVAEKFNSTSEDVYTTFRIKGLPGLALKETRGEEAKDLLGGRTWIADELLQDKDNNMHFMQTIMDEAIANLKNFYAKQLYKVNLTGLEVAHKFKVGNSYGIEFPSHMELKDIEKNIKEYLQQHHDVSPAQDDTSNKKGGFRERFDINIANTTFSSLSGEEKNIIARAIKNDNSKTGGNGEYADCKFRLTFELEPLSGDGETIKNLSYEHQIVNMDSTNEGGLSDHNIFLDPLKTIQATLRNSTAIDSGKFVHAVSGGIDKTIAELQQYKRYIDGLDDLPDGMPMKLVEKQFTIRNRIPDIICTIAGIKLGSSYIALDRNDILKTSVELAIAKYILHDQFEKGRLHWFVYDNDHIAKLTTGLIEHNKNDKSLFYRQTNSLDKMIEAALSPEGQASGKYCLCGGGSNNLTRSAFSGLTSEKGTIGIKDEHNGNIYWIRASELGAIVSHSTKLKQGDQSKMTIACTQEDIIRTLNQITE